MLSKIRRFTALALSLSLLLGLLASCGPKAKATTMHLRRTEGKVRVSDSEGKDLDPAENLGLYSGYGVNTKGDSYAWIDLDEVKLTKMDENSKVEIIKEDKHLTIEVKSGSLFFNITEPLADDETMDIRTSTMLVGIRGTCGWVSLSEDGESLSVYLLEGKVRCEADGGHKTVRAGEMAVMTKDGEITVEEFSAADIPSFVVEEVEDDDDLIGAILDASGIDVTGGAPQGSSEPGGGEDADIIASGHISDADWTLSSTGVLTLSGRDLFSRTFGYILSDIVEEAASQTGLPEDSIKIREADLRNVNMTSVGYEQFSSCPDLEVIILPDTVTSIERVAFSHCTSLTTISIPEGVTELGESVFSNCESLVSVTLPSSLTKIGRAAFSLCTSLTSINIPEGVTELGESAFWSCESLASVTLPSSLTKIGQQAFCYCRSLTSVVLPSGLTEVAEQVFSDCNSLTSVTIPRSVAEMGTNAFFGFPQDEFEVYYEGTESEWQAIEFGANVFPTKGVVVHYNSPMPY